MDPLQEADAKPKVRGKVTRGRAARTREDSSSSGDRSDVELENTGSRIRLFREKRKGSRGWARKGRAGRADDDDPLEGHVSADAPKESSLARSIKRKFAFFRRSESARSREDVEAAVGIPERPDDARESDNRLVDVVVDVHRENEEGGDSAEELALESLEMIQESPEQRLASEALGSGSELGSESAGAGTGGSERSIDESARAGARPTSGGASTRQRRRWDKSEITAEDLVEDLKKPRRRQWADLDAKKSATAKPHPLTPFLVLTRFIAVPSTTSAPYLIRTI
jgi:hypothetical protein